MQARAAFAAMAIFLASCASVAPPQAASTTAPILPDGEREAVSQGVVRLGASSLAYTAKAGRLPIRADIDGSIHGRMFFVSYEAKASEANRPVAFIWNGGPGANATLLHFEMFGPQRLEDGKLIDNAETLLDAADLVFVDPIGTGFSRPEKPEYGAEFYNVLGDLASVAEFIRAWRIRNHAEGRPIYLVGESYGVWRSAGVAEVLQKQNVPVAGVVLISGGVPIDNRLSRPTMQGLSIPGRTATAFHHRKLPVDLQANYEQAMAKSDAWSKDVYAPALNRLDQLSDAEKASIIRDAARFQGVPESAIDPKTLQVTNKDYLSKLLADEKKTLNTFDMRELNGAGGGRGNRGQTILSYYRDTLGYRTELAYAGMESAYAPISGAFPGKRTAPPSVGSVWDYNHVALTQENMAPAIAGEGPPGGANGWMSNMLKADPASRGFVAYGLYDSLNSCLALSELMRTLSAAESQRITAKCYPGGHMMYSDPPNRVALANDVRAFVRGK